MNELVRLEVGIGWFAGFVIPGAGVHQLADNVFAFACATADTDRPAMAKTPTRVSFVVVLRGFEIPGEQTNRRRTPSQFPFQALRGWIVEVPRLRQGHVLEVFSLGGESHVIEIDLHRPLPMEHVDVAIASKPTTLSEIHRPL